MRFTYPLKNLTAAFCLVCGLSNAQVPLALPKMQSCAPMTQCEMGLGKLTDEEKQVIEKLILTVTPGATEEMISRRLSLEPFSKIASMQAWGQPAGTTTYKANWSSGEDKGSGARGAHFDVMFINDRAVMFSWYAAAMRKIVRVQLVENVP